ncbi:MAG: flavodoxin family protein [Chloroflexi bacterium]|nr:flavodoxin family protein [Chloroflexota bacterium]
MPRREGRTMTALVVYDSKYSNTERVAQAIGDALGVVARRAGDVPQAELVGCTLLVVGSPT